MHFTRIRLSFWLAFQHGQFLLAKGAAYSSILTLFPALLAVAGILEASHHTEGFVRQIGATVGWVLPPGPGSIAMSFFQSTKHHPTRLIVSASMVTILAATGVMVSWMEGFRRAYCMQNTWGFWKERAVAVYLVFLALVPLSFATTLVVFGDEIESWMQSTMHTFSALIWFTFILIRWSIAILTSIAFIGLIYHHGMPKTQSWRRVLPGAALATLLWFPATMLFGWYVTNYATYKVVYGSLSAAIALLVWLYILSVIVLLGAEFNAQVYPKVQEGDAANNNKAQQ
jgi:membrane protein